VVRAGYLIVAAFDAIIGKKEGRMRRALLAIAIVCVLAAPAGAAEKLPMLAPRLVARIDGLFATQTRGNVVIQVKGAVDSGGWRGAKLRPLKSGPADVHTIVVEFVATPPSPRRVVITGLLPVAANTTVKMRRGVVSVRVVSGSNEITTQILKQ
jgi:hypothetical protein